MEAESVRIFYRALPVAERPLFCFADFVFLAQLPLLIGLAILPEKLWYGLCYAVEYIKGLRSLIASNDRVEKIRRSMSLEQDTKRSHQIKLAAEATRLENSVQVLREYMPHGWHPTVRLEGFDNLDKSLAKGKGAVLWVAHFAFASLATKKACAGRGYEVSHISRPEHGFTKSKFGINWLNPIRCGAEDRYLKCRVLIDRAAPGNAFRTALGTLKRGGIISVTAGAWEGRTIAEGRFLKSRLQLAVGAPRLAFESGADLLPVFTVRVPEGRTLVTTIGKALQLRTDLLQDDAIALAVRDYLSLLALNVIQYPEQWRGWDKMILDPEID